MKMAPLLVAVAISAFGMAGHADELFTANGSRLVGELVRTEDQSVTFKTPYAGLITINLANVERIVTDETVVIMLESGTIYRDRRIDATEKALVATM